LTKLEIKAKRGAVTGKIESGVVQHS